MAQENGNQYLTPEHLLYALVDADGGLIGTLLGRMSFVPSRRFALSNAYFMLLISFCGPVTPGKMNKNRIPHLANMSSRAPPRPIAFSLRRRHRQKAMPKRTRGGPCPLGLPRCSIILGKAVCSFRAAGHVPRSKARRANARRARPRSCCLTLPCPVPPMLRACRQCSRRSPWRGRQAARASPRR